MFRRATAAGALEEIAGSFPRPDCLELVLRQSGERPGEEARYRGAAVADGEPSRHRSASVPGVPGWTLIAGTSLGAPPRSGELREAASALAAWRAARAERARAEARIADGTRDLHVLHDLGTRSAEARSVDALFSAAAAILHEGADLDLVIAVRRDDGRAEGWAWLARPVEEAACREVAEWVARAAGCAEGADLRLLLRDLPGLDVARGSREGIRRSDALLSPLLRQGAPVAGLGVIPAGSASERTSRLFFAAANVLALHLDRILTVAEAERGRFRAILDSMPQAVFLADEGLNVLQANPAAQRLLETIGPAAPCPALDHLAGLDVQGMAAEVLSGRAASASGEAVLEGGTVLNASLSVVRGDRRGPRELVLVLADVTEARRIQGRLAQSDKLSSLGEMISGIAHELNNPLASVVGYAQLARGGAAEPKLAGRLAVIDREAQRCQRIVRNLLSFARRYEPERTLYSLNEVVESVLGLMAYQLRVGDVAVETSLDRSLPPVLGDPHEMQQAVLNLVTNAYQAIRGSGRRGTVKARTLTGGAGTVELIVEDDGPGIPDSIRSRIFDPFFTTKAPGQGTGLGLSLVYGAVAAHGGTIDVGRAESGGARFRIELPPGEAPALSPSPEEPETPPASAPRGRILVVDDEESVAALICEALGADGHVAEPARDGPEALARLEREEFDLVIADLRMPGMGGARLYEEIERMRPAASRRLLLTTGDTMSREPQALAEKAGIGVLLKPFDLGDLRRAVRARIRPRREA